MKWSGRLACGLTHWICHPFRKPRIPPPLLRGQEEPPDKSTYLIDLNKQPDVRTYLSFRYKLWALTDHSLSWYYWTKTAVTITYDLKTLPLFERTTSVLVNCDMKPRECLNNNLGHFDLLFFKALRFFNLQKSGKFLRLYLTCWKLVVCGISALSIPHFLYFPSCRI